MEILAGHKVILLFLPSIFSSNFINDRYELIDLAGSRIYLSFQSVRNNLTRITFFINIRLKRIIHFNCYYFSKINKSFKFSITKIMTFNLFIISTWLCKKLNYNIILLFVAIHLKFVCSLYTVEMMSFAFEEKWGYHNWELGVVIVKISIKI